MTKLGALFWIFLVLASGFTTFKVKYAVQNQEDQLNRVRRQTIAEEQQIRVLTAEWSYLTQPERLADLNRRFLGLAPITPQQLQTPIAAIPLRVPAAPVAIAAAPAQPPAASPLPVIAAALIPAAAPLAPPLRLAKAGSLDALIARIAERR
jgi:cell division protein FtsL